MFMSLEVAIANSLPLSVLAPGYDGCSDAPIIVSIWFMSTKKSESLKRESREHSIGFSIYR